VLLLIWGRTADKILGYTVALIIGAGDYYFDDRDYIERLWLEQQDALILSVFLPL
jgi:hypothetical protein